MELTIGGETFEVVVEGADERPAVLLSCSLGTDLTLFDAQMAALLEHFRVVRYDPRGHGGSTTAGAPYSLARLGRDALAILDALAIETTHFVGISMGGAVGQWLLVNAPQRIARAVLANTAARIGTPEVWNARITTVLAEGTQALSSATMERWFSPAFHASAPERVAAVDAVFRKTSAEGYAGACAALRDMDLREALYAIDRPVLIVTGREDAVAGAAEVATMMSAIRGARHLELDCRHISVIERDAAFNAAVVAFLTGPARVARPPRKPPTPRRAATGRTTAARTAVKPAPSAGAGTKRAARATPAKAARRAARGAITETAAAAPAAKTPAAKTRAGKAQAAKTRADKTPAGKTPAGKATTGKRPARKTGAKAAAKKVPRKSTARRTPTVRATPRKAVTKVASKKTPAKKTATKKAASKSPARRPAATRRPSPKRPGRPRDSRPGGRPKR